MGYDCTVLKIKLNKISRNYKILQKHLKYGCDIAAVIKANAYGLGQEKVIECLSAVGCQKFCVSTLDEAMTLPKLSKDTEIYIMHGVNSLNMARECAENNFIPALNHLQQIEYWNAVCKAQNKKLKSIIQIDTGMGRFGLSASEVKKILDNPDLISNMEIEYLMSHMSCAEQKGHPLTQIQLNLFKTYLDLFNSPKATFSNSAGIFLGEEFHFDMVRPGCALYGINPTADESNPMSGVVELQGYIAQKRIIESDQYIGYRAQYLAKPGEKLLIIECGYADGYVRSLSNKGMCYVQGYFLPVVGIISMDTVIVNASRLPENIFNDITHVELLGDNISIDDVAKYANTISYEILTTRFGNRCKRIYEI